MATFPIEHPVTPLRQRMIYDMAMRAMGARTQRDYVLTGLHRHNERVIEYQRNRSALFGKHVRECDPGQNR